MRRIWEGRRGGTSEKFRSRQMYSGMSGNLYIDCQKMKTPMRTTPAMIRTITYDVPQPCGAVPVSLYLH
jgi:hypothetical protein